MTEIAADPELTAAVETAPAAAAPGPPPPRRRRRLPRPMAVLRWSHRWVSIVAGLLLLTITTSGAVLLFEPELRTVIHPAQFRHSDPKHAVTGAERPGMTAQGFAITGTQAVIAAERAYPKAGKATRVVLNRGVYQVALGSGPETLVGVEPRSGKVLGSTHPEGGVLGFLVNLHECGLTCEGYPGYVKWLTKPMPDVGVQGVDKVERGTFVLATFGVILLLLVLSGVVLWWPGVRRWRRGFAVRRHKGRYGRDYDLHKLIGVVCLPFLAMWAITGMNFEFPVVSNVVYGIIGEKPGEDPTFVSAKAKKGTPDIGVERAVAAARAKSDGGRYVGTVLPAADDPTGTYLVWFSHSPDPYRNTSFPGQLGVGVDRHTGKAEGLYGMPGRPTQQVLWGDWTTGLHFGMFMGWIPRLVWLLFGLTPLALAITGMSTWLYKRGKGRERRRRRRAATAVFAD